VALLDTRGRVSQSKTGTLAPASYTYDGKGRLGELTQGAGADSRSAQFSYGTDGNLKTVTDALGRHVDFEHDVLGRVTKQTLPDGRETRTTYDANGNVTSITPPGRPAHIYTYDAGNQVSGYTAPSLGTGSTATTYAYDLEGHPTLITRPDGQTLTFNYNAGGQLSTVTTPSGTYGYSYDSAGRLSTLTESATGINLSYAYDGTLPLSTTWTGPVTGDVSRTYDNNFRTASQSVNGANTVNYAYDNDGLLTSAGDLSLTRDAENGLLSATTLGTVSDAWTYNSFGEPTNYAAKVSGSDAYSATFTRDALGRITTKNETIGAESHNYVYTYDPSGRLTTVEKDATPTTYTYDANGNRLKKVASGVTTNGTYDAQDRLLTYGGNTYTYTDNGELKTKVDATGTTTYTYDVSGNLRNVTLSDGKAIEYLIDGQNRRAAKKVNGTLTQGFLYNDQLQIVAELDGAGTVVSRFVYADRSNVPSFMEKGGTTYRIIADQLGSPRLVVNSADGSIAQKLDYDEFGNVLTDTNPGFIPFAFAGGLYDQNTKLVRFGARDYDPENGRWTIKDPIRFQSGEMNLYGYGMNDPINFIDPTGLSVLGDFFSGSGSYFIGLWRFAQQMGRSFGMLGETAQYNAYREQEILADLIKFTSQNSTARNIAFNSACSYVKNNKARITGRFGTAFGVTLLTSSVPGLGPILSASALTGDVLHLTQQGVETLDAISQATEALLGGE
jgi:RHS repeat-associated protein